MQASGGHIQPSMVMPGPSQDGHYSNHDPNYVPNNLTPNHFQYMMNEHVKSGGSLPAAFASSDIAASPLSVPSVAYQVHFSHHSTSAETNFYTHITRDKQQNAVPSMDM